MTIIRGFLKVEDLIYDHLCSSLYIMVSSIVVSVSGDFFSALSMLFPKISRPNKNRVPTTDIPVVLSSRL